MPSSALLPAGLRLCRFALLLALLSLAATVAADTGNIAAAAHGPVTTAFSRNTLQAIFGMRLRTWPDGTPIKVFVLPDNHPSHIAFCKQVLRVFPHEMRNAWDRLVFSGTGQAPVEVATEDEMRARLEATPGSIGYLSNATADSTITAIPLK